jgi:hypothetical protein
VLADGVAASPSRPTDADRRLVLVAGAGRSGTSTVAGVLQRLGLVVPAPEVPTDETNPRGFSESQWVVDFHQDLLSHSVVQVGDARPEAWRRTAVFANRPGATQLLRRWLGKQLAEHDELVIKDPRLAWFLPLWTNVARDLGVEPSFVTMLRQPAEIVGSKRTYYNRRLEDPSGIAAWLNMLLGTERATRGWTRVFVRYDDLLEHWDAATSAIGSALDLPALVQPTDEQHRAVDGFVDPALRRVGLTWQDLVLPARLEEMARSAWEALDGLAGHEPDVESLTHRLDAASEAYDVYYRESEQVSHSSVIAARERARRQATKPDDATGHSDHHGVAIDLARRVPPSVRGLVPARARARVKAALGRVPRR